MKPILSISRTKIQRQKVKDSEFVSSIGERIRSLRSAKKMSLQDLALKTDLTPSSISQIERGLSNPSIGALKRIAKTLGVPAFYFLMQESLDEAEIIVRNNMRKTLKNPNSNVIYELLSPKLNKSMEVVFVTLKPGQVSSKDFFMHTGEEACIVLSGKVALKLGETHYEMQKGDCCQFNAEIPHKYLNTDPSVDTQLLFVIAPPSF
jgi:transcriptional regulator with XRE-family HTH domain